jgi:glutathione S-transferase
MSFTLYMHPLSSYCWKVLTALYESATPFTPKILGNLGDAAEREAFQKVWPMGKFPVLRDEARNKIVPESTIIIEYLARHYPGAHKLIPDDPERALDVRLQDRFFDLYIHDPMQRIVGDRLRPADAKDAFGVASYRERIAQAVSFLEGQLNDAWAVGDAFSMADCAAAPALYYANEVSPFIDTHPKVAAYLRRLQARPSFARVLAEAEPYLHMFPRN